MNNNTFRRVFSILPLSNGNRARLRLAGASVPRNRHNNVSRVFAQTAARARRRNSAYTQLYTIMQKRTLGTLKPNIKENIRNKLNLSERQMTRLISALGNTPHRSLVYRTNIGGGTNTTYLRWLVNMIRRGN